MGRGIIHDDETKWKPGFRRLRLEKKAECGLEIGRDGRWRAKQMWNYTVDRQMGILKSREKRKEEDWKRLVLGGTKDGW